MVDPSSVNLAVGVTWLEPWRAICNPRGGTFNFFFWTPRCDPLGRYCYSHFSMSILHGMEWAPNFVYVEHIFVTIFRPRLL